jgi:hypothetical protein
MPALTNEMGIATTIQTRRNGDKRTRSVGPATLESLSQPATPTLYPWSLRICRPTWWGRRVYKAISKSSLSNLFWLGFRKADATARARDGMWITDLETRVQAGSNGDPVRHSFAFRVQIGSKPKACKSRVFSERCS